MLKLKEIYRNGVIAWSPFNLNHSASHFLAVGTAAGSFDIDFNTNNRLEILNAAGTGEFETVSETETKLGFTTLGWAPSQGHSGLGLIAGGTTEGIVNVYDPSAFKKKKKQQQQQQHSTKALLSSFEEEEEKEKEKEESESLLGGGGGGDGDDEAADAGLVCTVAMNGKSAISSLDFCPSQPNLLAVGNSHGSVAVTDLTDLSKTTYFDYKHKRVSSTGIATTTTTTTATTATTNSNILSAGEGDAYGDDQISCVLWNRRVAPIIATLSATTGTVTIWDMRKKMAIISFNDNTQGRVSAWRAAAWDPTEPTVLVTCCDNDVHPVVLWDLRSIQVPRYYTGHSRGVSSVAWSPLDPSLIVTAGRDKTLCWSPSTLETRFEVDSALPCSSPITIKTTINNNNNNNSSSSSDNTNGEATSSGSSQFASPTLLGIAPGRGEQRWDSKVLWSPHVPGALALCTFGAHKPMVSVMSVHDPATPAPPAWMKRPAGASFCAGNTLARFALLRKGKGGAPSASAKTPAPATSRVVVHRLPADKSLAERADRFQETVRSGGLRDICAEKMAAAKDDEERGLWGAVGAHFSENVRTELQKVLGYSAAEIESELHAAMSSSSSSSDKKEDEKEEEKEKEETTKEENNEKEKEEEEEEKMEEEAAATTEEEKEEEEETTTTTTTANLGVAAEGEEGVVTRALLVGRFDDAVEYCFAVGRDADALVLASYSSKELFERARARYAERRWGTAQMRFVSLLARGSLREVVETVPLEHWRAALAAVCTYADKDAFAAMAAALGARLEAAGSAHAAAAALCFVAAGDVARVVSMWVREQEASQAPLAESLAGLVEDLIVLEHAVAMETAALPEHARAKFVEYAKLLESQGFPGSAARYVDFLNTPAYSNTPYAVFLDRLYKTSGDSSLVLKAIPFGSSSSSSSSSSSASSKALPLSSSSSSSSSSSASSHSSPAVPHGQSHLQPQKKKKPQASNMFVPKPVETAVPAVPAIPAVAAKPAYSNPFLKPVSPASQPPKVGMMSMMSPIPQAPKQPLVQPQQQQQQQQQQQYHKPPASTAFIKPVIPTATVSSTATATAIPTTTPVTTAPSSMQAFMRPQMSQGAKMFTPAIPKPAAVASPMVPSAVAAASSSSSQQQQTPARTASSVFANVPVPQPAAATATAATTGSAPSKRVAAPAPAPQGMFIPKPPAAGINSSSSISSNNSGSIRGPQVPPSTAHPATKPLTVPLSETVKEVKPADPEKVAYIRGVLGETVPGMERSAAGTQHEPHVREMINKLGPLAESLGTYEGPVVDALYDVFKAVMDKDWTVADAAFARLIKSHGSLLKQGISVGLRFFMRLYKMLPQ